LSCSFQRRHLTADAPEGLVTARRAGSRAVPPWQHPCSAGSSPSTDSPWASPAADHERVSPSGPAPLPSAAPQPAAPSRKLALTRRSSWKGDTIFIISPPKTCGAAAGIRDALRKETSACKEQEKLPITPAAAEAPGASGGT